MKIKYAVNNLHSIEHMKPIELRPITILIGANNSGKSSLLRSFSLIKQSLREVTNEPILWFGDYVDFGDFSVAVKNKDLKNKISFDFELLDIDSRNFNKRYRHRQRGVGMDSVNTILRNVEYNILIKCKNNRSVLDEINVKINDYDLLFTIKFYVNKIKTKLIIENELVAKHDNGIISIDLYESRNYMKYKDINNINPFDISSFILNETTINSHFHEKLYRLLSIYNNKFNASIDLYDLSSFFTSIYIPVEKAIRELKERTNRNELKKFLNSLLSKENSLLLSEIKKNCIMNLTLSTASYLTTALRQLFGTTTSIGPARVQSERFYRFQGLAVSEIAIDGINFPMFLLSLEENNKLKEFSDWVEKLIGIKISVDAEGKKLTGNVSVNLVHDKLSVNIIDSGYGISQLLPVLAQIWLTSFQLNQRGVVYKTAPFYRLVTMEQPELHLHPKHQAMLADALVSAISNNSVSNRPTSPLFVVETHSEALISKLGALIREGGLSHEQVQILVFSKRSDRSNSTEIKVSTFNNEGTLSNWPHGFFNY